MTLSGPDQISERRTFAIISHPDAGKTTLTEHMLLSAGAIHMAGQVRAKKERRRARSDWMAIERERGISVASSVMTFLYRDLVFNLLDTPGHEDFSEDTYRALTAADSAVMVLDAARGIEPRTLKLFEVCRLRDIPILTFINKMDREARDPLSLLEEIEDKLAIHACPLFWPYGSGSRFQGVQSLETGIFHPLDSEQAPDEETRAEGRESAELAQELCPAFSVDSYLEGHSTGVLFGSALRSFGIVHLLDALCRHAPGAGQRPARIGTSTRNITTDRDETTGFIFRIQANMDPRHRDRIAFMRLCSGRFQRGQRLKTSRGASIHLNAAVLFMAQDRQNAESADPGDIIGIPCRGSLLRVGDSLSESGKLVFLGIPSFAPEILRLVRAKDPMKTKHVRKALIGLAEEGVTHLFRPVIGSDLIVGGVGQLQIDVMAGRLEVENNLDVSVETTSWSLARWVSSHTPEHLEAFVEKYRASMAFDLDDAPVFLARNAWEADFTLEKNPDIRFASVVERAGT